MGIQDMMTAVTTVGFPIAACIALYYQNLKTISALSELTGAITELKTYIELNNGKE